MENRTVAEIFDEIAKLLELQGDNAFRVRSYVNAARSVRDLPDRLEDMVKRDADLSELPGIGQSLAGKIREIMETGTCSKLEELRKELPPGLAELMQIPGLGARKAADIHKALGVADFEQLASACEMHQIRDLEGFGEKTEAAILKGIKTVQSTAGRIYWAEASQHVETLRRHLETCPLTRYEVAGSFRRRRETVGDLDILVEAKDREAAAEALLKCGAVKEVISRGEERISVRLESGLQVDFRFIEPSGFGAALMYFTGSKAHNVHLRRRARERGWKLNEYGLFEEERALAGKTEEQVYRRLDLAWVPPELREDRGEIEAAERGALPRLVDTDEIHGDLHAHTSATDGANTIGEMARAAQRRGYQFLAITDHSKAVRIAGGLDDEAMRRHADAIREADSRLKGFWLMAGVEVDILKDGRLDLGDDVLSGLDWVVASVHTHMDMPEKQMTARLLAAVRSGLVHCLGHPFGRLIGKRDPIKFDMAAVLDACREHGVCLEINAQPERLDLPDVFCRQAAENGVRLSIGTDAHSVGGLDLMRLGVDVARRGWLEKGHVLNTLSARELRSVLKRDQSARGRRRPAHGGA